MKNKVLALILCISLVFSCTVYALEHDGSDQMLNETVENMLLETADGTEVAEAVAVDTAAEITEEIQTPEIAEGVMEEAVPEEEAVQQEAEELPANEELPAAEEPAPEENVQEEAAPGEVAAQEEEIPLAELELSEGGVKVNGLLPEGTVISVEAKADPFAAPAPKKLMKAAAAPAVQSNDAGEAEEKTTLTYDVKLVREDTNIQPGQAVKLTFTDVPLYEGGYVRIYHIIDSAEAILAGFGTPVTDPEFVNAFPKEAAIAEQATGVSGVVYVEYFSTEDGNVEITPEGNVAINVGSFSDYYIISGKAESGGTQSGSTITYNTSSNDSIYVEEGTALTIVLNRGSSANWMYSGLTGSDFTMTYYYYGTRTIQDDYVTNRSASSANIQIGRNAKAGDAVTINNRVYDRGWQVHSTTIKVLSKDDIAKITYTAGEGGTVSRASESVEKKNGTAKGATATANDGYEFIRWKDSNGQTVSANATFTPSKPTGGWASVTYTAEFAKKIEVTYYLNTPANCDFEYEPWMMGTPFNTTVPAVTTVNAVAANGLGNPSHTYRTTSSVNVNGQVRIRSGNSTYPVTFLGWDTKEDGTGTRYKPGDKPVFTEKTNLYAIWGAEYTISYYKDQVDTGYQQTHRLGEPLTKTGIIGSSIVVPEGTESGQLNYRKEDAGTGYDDGEQVNTPTVNVNGNTIVNVLYTTPKVTYVNPDIGVDFEPSGALYNYSTTMPEPTPVSEGLDNPEFTHWVIGERRAETDSININDEVRVSYNGELYNITFLGWNTKSDGSGDLYEPGETPGFTEDTTLYAIWGANYTVKYYKDSVTEPNHITTGGGDATLANVRIGSTITLSEGSDAGALDYHKPTGYSSGVQKNSPTVAINGSTVVNVLYTQATATINYVVPIDCEGMGSVSPESELLNVLTGTAAGSTATPATGYKFVKWVDSEGTEVSTSATFIPTRPTAGWVDGTTYYAVFEQDTANYTVRHYQQNTIGFNYTEVEADKETLSGTIGQQTDAKAKDYTGFTVKTFSQETIKADGTTEVKIYYDRNEYNYTIHHYEEGTTTSIADDVTGKARYDSVVVVREKAITGFTYKNASLHGIIISTTGNEAIVYYTRNEYNATAEKETGIASTSGSGKYLYEGEVEFTAEAAPGYEFDGWYDKATGGNKVSSDLTYKFKMPAEDVTYYARAKELTVKYEYAAVCKDTVPAGTAFGSVDKTEETVNDVTGKPSATADPEDPEFRFVGWFENAEGTGDAVSTDLKFEPDNRDKDGVLLGGKFYAVFEYNVVKYTVKHMLENADDDGFTEAKDSPDELEGIATHMTEAEANEYKDFITDFDEEKDQKEISKDGDTVVEIQYKREKRTITYVVDGKEYKVDTFKIGQKVTDIDMPTKDGYAFIGWYTNGEMAHSGFLRDVWIKPDVMPDENITVYGRFIKLYGTLTIQKSGASDLDANQSFIFNVKGISDNTKDIDMKVTVTGNRSVTINELPIGKYKITEEGGWSWRYQASANEYIAEVVPKGIIIDTLHESTTEIKGYRRMGDDAYEVLDIDLGTCRLILSGYIPFEEGGGSEGWFRVITPELDDYVFVRGKDLPEGGERLSEKTVEVKNGRVKAMWLSGSDVEVNKATSVAGN